MFPVKLFISRLTAMKKLRTGKSAAYSSYSDIELVELMKASDYNAFTEIYNRFAGILYAFVRKRIDDKEDAEDVIQEFFTDLWTKKENIDIKGDLPPYLYVAIRHKMLNYIRRNITQKRYIDAMNFTDQETILTDHLIREKQLTALIDHQIDQLPDKMREVFLLSRSSNLTYSEISQQLDLPKHTIKNYVRSVMKILKVKLGLTVFFLFNLL